MPVGFINVHATMAIDVIPDDGPDDDGDPLEEINIDEPEGFIIAASRGVGDR